MGKSFSRENAKAVIVEHENILKVLTQNQIPNKRLSLARLMAGRTFEDQLISSIQRSLDDVQPTDFIHSEQYATFVHSLHLEKKDQELSAQIADFTKTYQGAIEANIALLKKTQNSLRWALTRSKTKQKIETGFHYLSQLLESSYKAWSEYFVSEKENIENIDTQTALANFHSNPANYTNTMLHHKQDLEGRTSTHPPFALRGLEDFDALSSFVTSKLNKYSHQSAYKRKIIESKIDEYRAQKALETLQDFPIETMRSRIERLRIKSLKNHNINTISDVLYTTTSYISSISGISFSTAEEIVSVAKDCLYETANGTTLRLSSDDRTPVKNEIVTILHTLNVLKPIQNNNESRLTKASRYHSQLKKLDPWSWLLLAPKDQIKYGKKKKYLLNKAIPWLDDLSAKIDEIEDFLSDISIDEIWEDFNANNILYFNLLEEICPGILGNSLGDTYLSDELIRKIQDEAFFPDGLLCELRPYQEWGVKYILHQKCALLGDEMGLGKTIQAIATMVSLKNTGATHFVVVCPASVLVNWVKEIANKSKLRVTRVHGADKMSAFRSWIQTGGVAVTTYETTHIFDCDLDFPLSFIIADEAHYLKNKEANRTRNFTALAAKAPRKLFMTGTPLENKVKEMISLISMLQPSIAVTLENIAHIHLAQVFREAVAPVYLRRKKEHVLQELPEIISNEEWLALSSHELSIYENSVYAKKFADMRRVSWNISDITQSSKANRLKEIVDEARLDNRKVIVFSYFLNTIDAVRRIFNENAMPTISGSIPPQRRQEIVDSFAHAPAGTVLPAQIQSAGTGLNIQSASVVVICEPQLKPSIEEQAIARAHRMGQGRNVLVYRLLAEETVDIRVMEILEEKRQSFNAFANQSVAGDKQMEEIQISNASAGEIIEQEIQRINQKRLEETELPEQ
ncbi:SNF2 family DNA or RNA helicase [Arcanobacterium pluranimalium]|uniref:DEAD/DEAH box helicase n=1 Tax=Arcanobacterium pluranimalium TaxID=108028 RepID=UPI00195AB056|nr:DEAD/DEAH box helicase [Arcanobacterium pluranimalium]MBM7824613.1 SNF2 family DNA or RNA helicase [Arcanobacterium pluranimalium]